MDFADDSSKIIKLLLPKLKEGCAYKGLENDEQFNKSLDSLLLLLYREIHNAEQQVKKIVSNPSSTNNAFIPVLEKVIKKPHMSGGNYYPTQIKEYIDNVMKYQLVYTFNIGGRIIKTYFGIFTEEDIQNIESYDKYARFLYSWLFICSNFSLGRCSKTLDIFLYFTPYKKTLPVDRASVISPEHVNSAFTKQCQPTNEIILYRKEEWMKVFIHETFHTFGFDFVDNMTEDIRKYVKELFPVKSEFRIGEAYVETWARILYAGYASYYSLTNKRNTGSFLLFMRFTLQMERLFSIHQMNKILHFMGLSYNDFLRLDDPDSELRRGLYNEYTNVLAYYVITALYMNNYYGFLLWCARHNSAIFKYSAGPVTNKEFIGFIQRQHGDPSLLKTIDVLGSKYPDKRDKKYLLHTTRMTAIELD